MLTAARGFWEQLARFRGVYAAAVRLGQIESADYEWALVDARELRGWLPGLQVPKMHLRTEYLVRLNSGPAPPIELDLHSVTYRGLFRVPL
jgi:hypothetical protein